MASLNSVVINLDYREDRLANFYLQARKFNLNVERISAIPGSSTLEQKYVSNNVAACWESHQKAYKYLVNSNLEHLIIFEDDAILNSKLIEFLKNLSSEKLANIDLLQFGYLNHKKKLDLPRFDRVKKNTLSLEKYVGSNFSSLDCVFRAWIRTTRWVFRKIPTNLLSEYSFPKYVRGELKLRNILGSKSPLIYHSFEPGTHGYVIGRELANFLLKSNTPVFLAADLHLMGLAASGNIKSLRLSKSLCAQDGTPSSII